METVEIEPTPHTTNTGLLRPDVSVEIWVQALNASLT